MTLFQYDPEKVSPEKKEKIEAAPEHMLYFMINEAGAARFRSKHDSADGRPWAPSIPESMKFEEEMFHLQAHCIRQLHKFGVENPLEDGSSTPTQEYWDWFRGWDSHVKGLPAEVWRQFEAVMNSGKNEYNDVSQWYPDFARERRGAMQLDREARFDAVDVIEDWELKGEPE